MAGTPTRQTRRKGARRPTLMDIAEKAGVAVSTVSAILGDKPHCYAAERTRRKVREAADELGYRPNPLARGLRGQTTETIGLILPILTGPIATVSKIGAVEDLAWSEGYRLLIGTSQYDAERERVYMQEFLSRQLDGFIIFATGRSNEKLVADLISQQMPVVTIESPYEIDTYDVTVDRELGGYLQVKHLIEQGYRKLGFIPHDLAGFKGRAKLSGQRRALEEAGLSWDPDLVFERPPGYDDHIALGRQMARQVIDSGQAFDAVVTTGDDVAVGAMAELLDAGLDIPGDVGLIGFSNDFYSEFLRVPLTTIQQPRQVGRIAFELLMQQMKDSQDASPEGPRKVVLDPELIVRQSTGGSSEGAGS